MKTPSRGGKSPAEGRGMTYEQADRLADAFFSIREVLEEAGGIAEADALREMMNRLHDIIDPIMEKGEAA